MVDDCLYCKKKLRKGSAKDYHKKCYPKQLLSGGKCNWDPLYLPRSLRK